MVTGGAGHCHVTGGELQSQRERERVISSSDRCKSFALDLRARTCGRQLSRRICVTNSCLHFVSILRTASQSHSIFCFLSRSVSCFVLLSCVFFFIFLIQASSSSSSSSVTFFFLCCS